MILPEDVTKLWLRCSAVAVLLSGSPQPHAYMDSSKWASPIGDICDTWQSHTGVNSHEPG